VLSIITTAVGRKDGFFIMKRVLVTRPAGQEQFLCDQLRQAGFDVVAIPTLAIEALPINDVDVAALRAAADARFAIFISANAARHSQALIGKAWETWPSNLSAIAVGPKTAAALQVSGLPAATLPETVFHSEALLALPTLQQLNGDKVLLFRGEGGRTIIRETLSERGAQVLEWATYRRICPEDSRQPLAEYWRAAVPDFVICTSVESFSNLVHLLGPVRVLQATMIAISERVATHIRQFGNVKVCVAAAATDEGFIETLKNNVAG
jgi:uroporphyrinogen-III synthase